MPHSSIGLPPDSTGKKLHTHTHNINGEEVHNQIFSLGDVDSDNFQKIDEYGAATVRFAGGGAEFDSFGKMKISQETTLSSHVPIYDNIRNHCSIDQLGNSSLVHSPNESAYRLQVDTGSADSIAITTNKYHLYTPGTTNTILMTVVVGEAKENVRRRWGFFDEFDGLFFEQKGSETGLVIRSSVSGSVVENKVLREDFNGDLADGSGVSGFIINPTKSNIYWIDYQWLGVGAVRFGVVSPDGSKILLHTFENANKYNTVYMRTGSLPLRWELSNIEATGSISEFKMLNSTVKVNDINPDYRGKLKAGSASKMPVDNTYSALLSIKPGLMFKGRINRTACIPTNINVFPHNGKVLSISIVKNAQFIDSGTNWYNGLTGGATLFNKDMVLSDPSDYNTLGNLVYTTLITEGQNINLRDIFSYIEEYACLNANGLDADTYTIIGRTLITNETEDVTVGIHWDELYM